MVSVDFTRLLVETIPSPESEKGLQMENEIREDEFVETAYPVETEEVEEINEGEGFSIGEKVFIGLSAAAAVAAGSWAGKKFGPKVKAFTDKKKLEHLKKQQEKLAAKQAANQVKINQLSTQPETGKKES